MKLYEWLNDSYQEIISCYQNKRGHHAVLLNSQSGNGEILICQAISNWLMCRIPKGNKNCGVCCGCQLMKAGNHPDYYQIKLKKGQQTIGVDDIRAAVYSIYNKAHQGGAKVICLFHTEKLTDQAANSLLKIVEEPPKDTYFLLICEKPTSLMPTLKSRCICWTLPVPHETLGLKWLRNNIHSDKNQLSMITALRLCANAPLAAKNMLQSINWQLRLSLCLTIEHAILHSSFLLILPKLVHCKNNKPIYWLISLLIDAMKLQHGVKEFLFNVDNMSLLILIAKKYSARLLQNQLKCWTKYLYQCQKLSGVNRELLLTNYLLNWERSSY